MQQTLKSSAILKGIGLHSGIPVSIAILPADENSGIAFVRTDVQDKDNIIPARWDCVVDTRLCTVIGNQDGVSVGTIEHLMAALRGCAIDNAIIEIDGPEVPVMDGSSMPFVEAIEEAGIVEQALPRRAIKVLKTVSVERDGKRVSLEPSDDCSFSGEIQFDHPQIGAQRYKTQLVNGNFKHDIAEARTFGFAHEVEYMRKNGLALGGSLENAIVLDEAGILNPEGLRYRDEFIRHKILDAIGDLYLAGAPILGLYEGAKAGHAMNNEILKALFADHTAWEFVEISEDVFASDMPVLMAAE